MAVSNAQGSDVEEIEEYLRKSATLYHNKKYKKCEEILNKVVFNSFDNRESVKKNNLLLCKLKTGGGPKQMLEICHSFQSLIHELRGLPPQTSTIAQEMVIYFNYSIVLLTNPVAACGMIDSGHQACTILTNGILRAARALAEETVFLPEGIRESYIKVAMVTEQEIFEQQTCEAVQKTVDQMLSTMSGNESCTVVPLVLSLWMISLLWVSQHKVKAGTELLESIQGHLNKNAETRIEEPISARLPLFIDSSLVQDVFPLCLLPTPVEIDRKGVGSMVTFFLSLCHYSSHKLQEAIQLLDQSHSEALPPGKISFYTLYLKGLALYHQGSVNEALSCFTKCESYTQYVQESHVAGAVTMIGRCLSTKGKPHTAVAKFKLSLACCDPPYLDPLYHAAMEFGKLKNPDTQVLLLKTTIKGLLLKRDNSRSVCAAPSLLCGEFKAFMQSLNGSEVSLGYATYTLARLCTEEKRYNESSDAYLDLLSELTDSSTIEVWSPCYQLPAVPILYRDCALALLSAGRFRDCVTVCDQVLMSSTSAEATSSHVTEAKMELDPSTEDEETASCKKRPRMPSSDETADLSCSSAGGSLLDLELMLFKARSLVQMEQLLPALECLKRLFNLMDDVKVSPASNTAHDVELRQRQENKRRKLDSGLPSGHVMHHSVENRQDDVRTIKAQAHLVRGLVLQSLHQDVDSVEELHKSLLWDPGSLPAAHHYSSLLLKLGRSTEATYNWVKIRGLDSAEPPVTPELDSLTTGIPISHWITTSAITTMDDLALQYYQTK